MNLSCTHTPRFCYTHTYTHTHTHTHTQLRGMSMLLGDALSHSKRPSATNVDESFIVMKVNRVGARQNEIQILGMQGNEEVNKEIQKQMRPLQNVVDCVLTQSMKAARGKHVGMQRQEAEKKIDEIIEKLHNLPESLEFKTSVSSNLMTFVMRLCLGEVLAATITQVGAGSIGLSKEVYDAGMEVLTARNMAVFGSKSVGNTNVALRRGSGKRPNIQNFLCNGLEQMCKKAADWKCKARLTSFVCVLCYSLMGGEECAHVETWRLSECLGDAKNFKFFGGRRFLKGFSKTSQMRMLRQCLWAFYDGTFFMLPHAHEFPSNFRGCQTVQRESVLTAQVFDFVVKQLESEQGANPLQEGVAPFDNYWTNPKNAEVVKAILKEPKKAGAFRVCLDAGATAQVVGTALHNAIDFHLNHGKNVPYGWGEVSKEIVELLLNWSGGQGETAATEGSISSSKPLRIPSSCFSTSTTTEEMSNGEVSNLDVEHIDVSGFLGDTRSVMTDTSSGHLVATHEQEQWSTPSRQEVDRFRLEFHESPDRCPLIVVVSCCYASYLDRESVDISGVTRRTYAVYSFHDGNSCQKQPAVVFRLTNKSGSATLEGDPMFFGNGQLPPECWALVDQGEDWSQKFGIEDGVKFIEAIEESILKEIITGRRLWEKWNKTDALASIFGDGSINSACAIWMVDSYALPVQRKCFPTGLERAGIAVECALAGSEGRLEPRRISEVVDAGLRTECKWEEACFGRTGRWLSENGKKYGKGRVFKMLENESPVAFLVDLVNLPTLAGMMSGHEDHDDFVCIIVIRIDFSTRVFGLVEVCAPSWIPEVRFDKTKFIILVLSEDKTGNGKYEVMSLVPRLGSKGTGGDVSTKGKAMCGTVMVAEELKRCSPKLYDAIVQTPTGNYTRFREGQPPTRWLRKIAGFESIGNFCSIHRWLELPALADGCCCYWSMLIAMGLAPSLPHSAEEMSAYRKVYTPLLHRLRQMVGSAILGVHSACQDEWGPNYDAQRLFKDEELRTRWRKVTSREVGFDPMQPGNHAGDIEIATLACVMRADVNILVKEHAASAVFLQDVSIKAFHQDPSSTPAVTMTESFPDFKMRSPREGRKGPLTVIENFIKVDLTALNDARRSAGYFGLLALHMNCKTGVAELPQLTMQDVVARGMLHQTFGRATGPVQPSVFLLFQHLGSHYEPLMVCESRPLTRGASTRKSAGIDVIIQCLRDDTQCSPGLSHLMAVAAWGLVDENLRDDLVSVFNSPDDASLGAVCALTKRFNCTLTADKLYDKNREVLAPQPSTTRAMARPGQQPVPAPLRHVQTIRLVKDTLLLVPIEGETLRRQLELAPVASLNDDFALLRVCATVLAMLCHCALVREADMGHCDANNLLFRLGHRHLAREEVRRPATKKRKKRNADTVSTRAHSGSDPSEPPLFARLDLLEILLKSLTRMQGLVDVLCKSPDDNSPRDSNSEWVTLAKLVSVLCTCCKPLKALCPTHGLWRSAWDMLPRLGQPKKEFRKGFVVQASAWEVCGLMSDKGFQGRSRLFPLPTLIVFPSQIPGGGLGVFAWHGHPAKTKLTEYAGRVLDRAGATALKTEGKHTHLRVLEKPCLFLDGRPQAEFGLTLEHLIHHQQVTVWP